MPPYGCPEGSGVVAGRLAAFCKEVHVCRSLKATRNALCLQEVERDGVHTAERRDGTKNEIAQLFTSYLRCWTIKQPLLGARQPDQSNGFANLSCNNNNYNNITDARRTACTYGHAGARRTKGSGPCTAVSIAQCG